jgi:GH24 family phage-related lysozyme (muramidase)
VKTSDQGLQLLIGREGCRLKPYRDTVGIWTDGYGNTVGVVPNGPPITQQKAEDDLRRNLDRFEQAVDKGVKVPIPQHAFDALVSFAFNVGVNAFLTSTMLKRINDGDMAGAAAQFDRWHIPPEITSRRNGEREQFRGAAFEPRIT